MKTAANGGSGIKPIAPVRKRGGTSTNMDALLKQEHPRPAASQKPAGNQAADTATNNDHIMIFHSVPGFAPGCLCQTESLQDNLFPADQSEDLPHPEAHQKFVALGLVLLRT
jgi:hypothetical protein